MVRIYIVRYSITLAHTIINVKCETSDFVLPSVSVGAGETVNVEEETGWQPMSAISLQQSL